MYYNTDTALGNLLELFLFLCIFVLAGLAVFLWSFVPKMAKSSTDITIQSDLQPRLRSLSQANTPLKVIVGHGTVRLEGTINDQYEHDVILEVAKQGAGTNKVQDALEVRLPQSRTQERAYRYEAWQSRRRPQNDTTAVSDY
jgi:hypothetical protein